MILICLVLAFSIMGLLAQPVAAVPAGFQEFFIPMPCDLTQDIFVNIDNDPAVSDGMHYVVGVTASADNTVLYYDHWEDGYESPGSPGYPDEQVALSKGQVHKFESSNVPSSPRGTAQYYDGGDRIFVSGSLLQLVVSTWPESPGTVFTDAWEVYPVQAWENQYVVPVGEAIAGDNGDFDKVWIEVMSGSDGNSITVTDGATSTTVTRNKGTTYTEEITSTKAIVSSTAHVQVHVMTGAFNSGTSSEMRGFTATPQAYWSNNYYAPVPSWTTGANSNLWLYNPNSDQITINWEERFNSSSFTINAGATRSYYDGTGHYVPTNSGAHLSSSDTFWGIGTCDTGSATYDWGYALIPFAFLGTDNYLSWSPGTSDLSANGSPVYIMATTPGTTIYIDYGPNDGVWDQTLTPNWLQPQPIRDLGDNDNTGMHIVSTAPVAIAWGESPNYAGQATPYLDMGYTTLPLPIEWIDVALEVEKTADPTTILVGEQSTFTVHVRVPSTAGAPVVVTNVTDKLPPYWEYVSSSLGTPSVTAGSLSTGWLLTWILGTPWTINPGSSQSFSVVGMATGGADVSVPNRNAVTATGTSVGANLTADDDAFVTVSPSADLSLTKDVDDPTPDVGSNVTFTIVVSNGGPSDATGVNVTDVLPYGLTFVSADPAASYNTSTGVWTVGNLTNGANATLTIVATASDLGGSGVTNTARASAITIDPALGNNAASAGVGSTSSTVGYNVLAVNKAAVMAPWIASAVALMAGFIYLVRRRVSTRR
jgi:uncharacterized repeat protein (TIGR01451 family)